MPLDPRAERLLRMLTATGGGEVGAAGDRRSSLKNLAEVAGGHKLKLAQVEDLTVPGAEAPLPARRYNPANARPGRILFFHGGGWVAGDLDTHDGVCRRLAQASQLEVLAIDYRLAPEHPFPAGLEDAKAAIRWVQHAGTAPLVVAGDSAGANLATAACLATPDDATPDLLLLLCPILDLAAESPSRVAMSDGYFLSRQAMARDLADYLPKAAMLNDPRLSPLRAENLSVLPPTHVHLAEFDPFRDEGLAFGEKLQAAGVDARVTRHDGMIHYFYALSGAIPYAEGALEAIGAEVRATLDHNRT
jgi:acetyl esterase/lipase